MDKDRTPTTLTSTASSSTGGKQSAISRLENKYSDILERAAGRRRHEEDRDKTLEPDDYGASTSSGLLRSATSHQLAKSKLSSSSFNASDRKERTPYRTRAQRQRYMADSTDSGYLTSGNRLLDDSYPLDYGQRYDYHDALRLGGATGYPSSRYGRRGGEEEAAPSQRSARAYGRTKTMEGLLSADIQTDHHPVEDRPLNSRNRFAHRRKEQPPPELTAEEREILADDRSSEDNAAILMLLREDNQFLEAKKFEERMRKRRDLRDRVKRMEEAAEEAKKTEAAVAAAEAEAAALELEAKKAKETAAAAAAAASATAASAAVVEAPLEAPKKKSRTKKVTSDDSDESTSESSSDEAETETETDSAAPGVQPLTHTTTPQTANGCTTTSTSSATGTANTTTATTSSSNTTTSSSTLSTSTSALSSANHTTTAAAAATTPNHIGTTNQSRFLTTHSDRNNNDLAKYKPGNQLMHSSSSGALAFGGIGARLAAADARRQQQRYQGASSRTAAVLSEFDRYKPGSSGSSYLQDSYGSSSSNSRRSNALGLGSSLYPQRSHLDSYQQQHQQSSSSSYLQQHDNYSLAKSATSSALFHRSRIPKTLSTFVSRRLTYRPHPMGILSLSFKLAPPLLTATATATATCPWLPMSLSLATSLLVFSQLQRNSTPSTTTIIENLSP